MKKNVSIFCLLMVLFSFSLFAEEVHLINGKIIPGTILSSDTESINLKTDYGELRIERKDISSIECTKPVEKKKFRKFAMGFEMNPYSFYGSALPLWGVGIRYIPIQKFVIKVMGSYFSYGGNSWLSFYSLCGYPIKLSENPEMNIFLNVGYAYQNQHYYSYNYSLGDYGYSDYNINSALLGATLEHFPLSYLPNFGYSVEGGLYYTWFPSNLYYSNVSFYLGVGFFYYLF